MRTLLTRSQAKKLLDPYASLLSVVLRSALLDWGKLVADASELTGGLKGRTRASYVHDRIVYRLQTALLDRETYHGLRLVQVRGGLWVLVVHDQITLKLKKLDEQLRSRNVPTGQTELFNAQGVLAGTAVGTTNATAGYTLDALNALPMRLAVVCHQGTTELWHIDLEEGTQEGGGTVLNLSVGPAGGKPSPARTRVRKPVAGTGDSEPTS